MSGQKFYLRAPRLFDGADQQVRDAAVLIEGREIAAVGRAADIACPDDASSVDLRDCTLLPGLIDCHDHLGIDMGQEEAQSHESAAWHTVKAVRNARRCLEAGITTMRDLGELHHVEIEWRRAIASGLMDGPDLMDGPELLVAGEFITRTGGHGWFFGREADGPNEVRRAVREQLRVGADVIKIMVTNGAETAGAVPCAPGYTREEIGAAVVRSARRQRPQDRRSRPGRGRRSNGRWRRGSTQSNMAPSNRRRPQAAGRSWYVLSIDVWRRRSASFIGLHAASGGGSADRSAEKLRADASASSRIWRPHRDWRRLVPRESGARSGRPPCGGIFFGRGLGCPHVARRRIVRTTGPRRSRRRPPRGRGRSPW